MPPKISRWVVSYTFFLRRIIILKGRIGGTNNLADSLSLGTTGTENSQVKYPKEKKLLRFLFKKTFQSNSAQQSPPFLSPPLSGIIVIQKLWGTSNIFFVVHLFFLSLFLILLLFFRSYDYEEVVQVI